MQVSMFVKNWLKKFRTDFDEIEIWQTEIEYSLPFIPILCSRGRIFDLLAGELPGKS